MHSPHFKVAEVMFYPIKDRTSTYIIWHYSVLDISPPPRLVHSAACLYRHGFMPLIYVIIQYNFLSGLTWLQSWPLRTLSVGSSAFDMHLAFYSASLITSDILFSAYPHFPEMEEGPSSVCTLPVPALESAIFPKVPWPLLLENGIRNQNLGARCVPISQDIIASRLPLLTKQGDMCICASYLYIHIAVNTSICDQLYLY